MANKPTVHYKGKKMAKDIIKELTKEAVKLQSAFLDSFMGVKVIVDTQLQGNEYYVAISEELYHQLKDRKLRR
jgi:hypothetical protein